MLHCPRCSGPLEVAQQPELRTHLPVPTTMASQQPQSQDLNSGKNNTCPAGSLCPHLQQPQQQSSSLATSNQAVNYMCGGGIVLPTPPSQSRSQHINSSLNSAASNLLQQQQQQQQPRLHMAQPVLLAAPTLVMPTTNHQAPSQPLFLTSTINQLAPLQPSMAISTLCHPATPAIVVGSTSPPFFHHQQQQQPHHHHHHHHQSCWPQNNQSHHHHHHFAEQPQAAAAVDLPAATIHQILERNKELLEQTNWYYPSMKWNESSELLCESDPGTFLVRDSADPNFLFSLSVQRDADGPTSVRIQFQKGKFKLDAEESIRDLMPEFGSVVELIEHYMATSSTEDKQQQQQQQQQQRRREEFGAKQVFVDSFGKLSSPICLRKPLFKQVPSLAHLARLTALRRINRGEIASAVDRLDLPKGLAEYLTGYPHKV